MLAAPHHAQRLLLAASTAVALLLFTACGGTEAEIPADDSGSLTTATASASNSTASSSTSPSTSSTTADDSDTETTESSGTTELTPVSAEQYLLEASELIEAVTATSNQVATQLENADVESATWRTDTATTLRELAAILDSTAALAAPPEYANQHQALIDATSKYSWATEMLADGVETLDLTTIGDAAALLANASVELATAQASLTS